MSIKETEPTMARLMKTYRRRIEEGIHTGMPGRVVLVHPVTAGQVVRVDVRLVVTDEDGLPFPVLPKVPVQYPQGGSTGVYLPFTEGDPCWVKFGERDFDEYLDNGLDSDPDDLQQHQLSNAVVEPGLAPEGEQFVYTLDTDKFQCGHFSAVQAEEMKFVAGSGGMRLGNQSVSGAPAVRLDLFHVVDELILLLQTATVLGAAFDAPAQARLTNVKAVLALIKEI